VGLSIASLILGIAALFSGPLTGIPAVICGWIALARKRGNRGLAIAGVAAGSSGTLFVSAVWAVVLIVYLSAGDSAKRDEVWRNMGFVHTAMENWYVDHLASYPGPEVSWEPGVPGMADYFPDAYPENPYTGERYRYGVDLFYFPDWRGPGVPDAVMSTDPDCPYEDLFAPEGRPGTIVVLGWSEDRDSQRHVERYAVVGFGKDTEHAIHSAKMRKGTSVWTYRVRLN
jgi:hypothetical protein